jgi:hypothetical protein
MLARMDAELRGPRRTWLLVLASAVPLYALPMQLQGIYDASRWPVYYVVEQTAPGEVLGGTWWLCRVAPCCVFLVLAATVPCWLHARWLARLELPVVEGALGPFVSYRHPVERRSRVHARGVRAVVVAYYARLAAVLVLLMPALAIAYRLAAPSAGWGSVMPPTITFSSPEEYLPVFVLATVVLLLNAPTIARMLGPHTAAFMAGDAERDG